MCESTSELGELAEQLERELTSAKEEAQLLQTLLKQRDSENAETLAEAVKIENERNLLRKRVEAADGLAAAMEGIGNYTGEGGPGTPWRDIVRDLGARAREVLVEFRATEGKK